MENKKEVATYPWWQAALANAIDMLIFGMGSLISFLVYSRPVNNMSDTAVVFLLALPFLFMFVTMGLYVWPKIWGKRTLGQIIMKCPCPIISDQQKDKPKSFVSKYFYYVFGPLGATYYYACSIDVGLIGGMSIVSLFLIMISLKSIYMSYAAWLLPLVFGFYWFLYYTLTDIFFDATLGELLFKVNRTPKSK